MKARAREAAENTAEEFLRMRHDGRVAFDNMRAAVQIDESSIFDRDFIDKYTEYR